MQFKTASLFFVGALLLGCQKPQVAPQVPLTPQAVQAPVAAPNDSAVSASVSTPASTDASATASPAVVGLDVVKVTPKYTRKTPKHLKTMTPTTDSEQAALDKAGTNFLLASCLTETADRKGDWDVREGMIHDIGNMLSAEGGVLTPPQSNGTEGRCYQFVYKD